MIQCGFYGREKELFGLKQKLAGLERGELVLMYGRRRVGKTELVQKFLEGAGTKKLYFYIDLMERPRLLEQLSAEISKQLGEQVRFGDWDGFFDYLHEKAASEKLVVAIDEFQRFLEISPDFITRLQHHWDSRLRKDRLMLVIVGSSIGMMLKVAKSAAGPLYGRVSSRMKISPFRYADFRKMFKEMKEEEKIGHYATFGGTPYYLAMAKEAKGGLYERIQELMLEKGGKLYEEPAVLMESEKIRTHARYNSILQAISIGKETTKEIGDFTKIPQTTLPAYLKKMEDLLDLIHRKGPVLGKEKHGRYRIKDNFFKFWYRFIFPNQSAIQLENTGPVMEEIKKEISGHTGRTFEGIAEELLISYNNKKIKGMEIDFEETGSWWDRSGNEIDIVAYNRKKGKILLAEVKWTNEKADTQLLESLINKSKLLGFKGRYLFMLVSKSGFTGKCESRLAETGSVGLDLKEMEGLFDAAG